ncbi:MAG: 5,5'-dehydrodivanillate O-demethylase [Alphaproteobacteria bacterium]|jgi:5,5'-dehydrodivanillate O-demethylase
MTPEENEALTRVGPGTPGGEMLRRYWWPVYLSAELKDKPVEVRHLGEDFVIFRDGSGQTGIVARHCPHRGASLALGRVEENGIRCCYHGWKFATNGQCLEMPAEPEGSPLVSETQIRAGHVQEVSGFVYAYIGPDPVPELPKWDLLFREDCHREVWAKKDYCNWVQRAENGADPYHSMALHAPVYPSIALKRPEVEWERKWYGIRQCSQYPDKLRNVSHQIFPSSTRRHGARVGTEPSEFLHIRVPVDDFTTQTFYVKANIAPEGPYRMTCKGFLDVVPGVYARVEDGWWGIHSNEQDRAAQESQGPIYDRSKNEHLGTSDQGVALFRKMAFESIEAVKQGKDPVGIVRDASTNEVVIFDSAKNFSDESRALGEELAI